MRFLADEDFDIRILRGLQRRDPGVDIVRVQEAGVAAAADPAVLDFAAKERRIVLTHDTSTMSGHAFARLEAGTSMPGIFILRQSLLYRTAIDELEMIVLCSESVEWRDQVRHLRL